MKKNKIVFSLLVTVLLCTFLYLKKAHRRVNPEWALLNIEALALGEDPDIYCFGIGSIDCPVFFLKVNYVNK